MENTKKVKSLESWDSSINLLQLWRIDQSVMELDEDGEASITVIDAAIRLARACKDLIPEMPPPTRVLPDMEGGIMFERYNDCSYHTITITKDLAIEYDKFYKSELIIQEKWPQGLDYIKKIEETVKEQDKNE